MTNKTKLLSDFEHLLKEWDYVKNQNNNPYVLIQSSSKKVWWICPVNEKHKWKSSVATRTRGSGCPYCAGKKVLYEESLGYLYKEFILEWHPQKNNDLTPFLVRPFSNKRIWWICKNRHEWETTVNSRIKGKTNCPYCSRNKVSQENSLASTHPNLAIEWHPKKNEPITPDKVLCGTQKKYWWICEKRHEWEASCNNRSKGKGCPYCKNSKASIETCLATVRPELLLEWDYSKNKNLSPQEITRGSDKIAWWKCLLCSHEWKTRIKKRTRGQGCPKCSKQYGTSFGEQALYFYLSLIFKNAVNKHTIQYEGKNYEADIYLPSINLAIEYDGEYHRTQTQIKRDEQKNKTFKQMNLNLLRVRLENLPKINSYGCFIIHCNSGLNDTIKEVLGFITELGSNFNLDNIIKEISIEKDRIKILEQYIKRHKENSLLISHPELAVEWHQNKNGKLNIENFTAGSNFKVWWICKNGHEWNTTINHRANGTNCPYCTGQKLLIEKSLAHINPTLASQWHSKKNGKLTPYNIAANSNFKVWWSCNNGHEFEATVNNRNTLKRGCPFCSGRKATSDLNLGIINPKLAAQWHSKKNDDLTPYDIKPNSGKKVWWICKNGHEWEARVQSRNKGSNCPYCKKSILTNYLEI